MDQSTEDYVVGLPERYALSLFELAQEEDEKDFVEKIDQELLTVGDIINSNNDLSALIKSPIFSSTEQFSLMTYYLSVNSRLRPTESLRIPPDIGSCNFKFWARSASLPTIWKWLRWSFLILKSWRRSTMPRRKISTRPNQRPVLRVIFF